MLRSTSSRRPACNELLCSNEPASNEFDGGVGGKGVPYFIPTAGKPSRCKQRMGSAQLKELISRDVFLVLVTLVTKSRSHGTTEYFGTWNRIPQTSFEIIRIQRIFLFELLSLSGGFSAFRETSRQITEWREKKRRGESKEGNSGSEVQRKQS